MQKTGNSRLLQMQARFQQKQLQEREVKIASLYEAQQARALDRVRHSPSNGVSGARSSPQEPPKLQESEIKIASLYEAQQARALDRVHHSPSIGVANGNKASPQDPKAAIHPGKVRQMFEERRSKGIDKSYPLQPIHNTDRTAARKPIPNGFSKVTATNGHTKTTTSNSRFVEKKKVEGGRRTMVKKTQHQKTDNIVNGSGDLNHNHEQDLHAVKQSLPRGNGEHVSVDELDRADNNYLLENETFPDALAPAPTPRSPEPHKEPKRPPRRSPPNRNSQPKEQPQPVAPPRRTASDKASSHASPSVSALKTSVSGHQASPRRTPGRISPGAALTPGAGGGSGEPCSVCGRRFAPDRLERHQEICRKAANKKRKPFDALKHRLAGTEAEALIPKLRKQGAASNTKLSKPINGNWRQKHEEFINAIRAAKQVQSYLKAGGKLSDLPPPPPSENPDYVQCPHCKRRFNQAAADRHVPKCAGFQFNKSKGGSKTSVRR
ncbi:hypothetical protein O0L34_g11003 [Tuta absoluta]|nr:hypothetical protein O0L34_g11003 [Tuta absoluta]